VGLRLTFVTLGARDLPALADFYRRWGWTELPGGSATFVAFDAGGVRLALYPLDLLGAEAAPTEIAPAPGWNGVTLAVNVAARDEVDAEVERARSCGAGLVGAPTGREWDGYSGYVRDPEGNRWEIAWAPGSS
jgi:uncharacterized protein